jgi:hypothetical protein
MGARHYDAELGRFLEADDRQPDVDNPRQLNRYAFAGGNPLNVRDPTGHAWLDGLLVLFTAIVAILVGVLMILAAAPVALAAIVVIVSAFFAAGATAAIAWEASGHDPKYRLTVERIFVVGLVIGGLVAIGLVIAVAAAVAAPLLTKFFTVMLPMMIDTGIEVAFDIGFGIDHGTITEGNEGLAQWAFVFVATTAFGFAAGAAKSQYKAILTASGLSHAAVDAAVSTVKWTVLIGEVIAALAYNFINHLVILPAMHHAPGSRP